MERILNQKKYFVFFIGGTTLVITYLHYSTLPAIRDLHNIFGELYYLPLLVAALVFGLKGAVSTFIIITILYAPFVFINWTGTYLSITSKLLHALFSGSFAIVAGILVDREKRRLEQTERERYLAGLGRAAAAIAHDLKNPIISILGFSRRILERKGDIDAASQAVLDSAQDMQDIVHDVLDFAKPVSLDSPKADIFSVIRKVCRSCEAKALDEGIVLKTGLPDETVSCRVDQLHMERALVNLINNAIEASRKGGMVVVSAEAGENRFVIKIKDYGEGMDNETLENVFIPFYTKKISGTGLGMAIAKKIIEAHQGSIQINSREHSGTEVIIKLPLKTS